MSLGVRFRFRDALRKIVPVWLSDRPGLNVGFRYLYALVSILDDAVDFAMQGIQAAWPGIGTPTALPYIGRTRGIVRGMVETDGHYSQRLRGWLEAHALQRTEGLATQLHEYLAGNPRVRVISRRGDWVTVGEDGAVTFDTATWDWDSVSNPERADFWSELFIVIYPTTWIARPGILGALTGDDGYGLGQMVPHANADTVREIIADWKGAHSRIRAVLWCSDPALYDPSNPASCPDGTCGQWGLPGSDPYVAGGRDLVSTRYWEPNG